MSKATQQEIDTVIYDTDISDEDYGFILDANGNLKSIFLPEDIPFKQPKNVQRILKIFGITDADQLDGGSIH